MANMNTKHERPDYVLNFVVPPFTEIKHVKGHWYLYERSTIVLPDGTRKKKSGHIIGTITPNGLVESRKRQRERVSDFQSAADERAAEAQKAGGKEEEKAETAGAAPIIPQPGDSTTESQPSTVKHGNLSDTVEVGASAYFYERTLQMRLRLKEVFPEMWQFLYVIAMIRVIYGPHFRRIKLHYQTSMLGEIFPGLDFNPPAIRSLLVELGKMRATIREFMLKDVRDIGRFLLVDGHRLITASQGRDPAECGYDSRLGYKPQINLLYLFSLGENLGLPAYYKQYSDSTLDVSAFEDILNDCNLEAQDVIAVTDKVFGSEDDFDLLDESGLNYIIPLKRNNTYIKDKIPATPADYEYAFRCSNRTIFFSEIDAGDDCDFKIFLYCDISLYEEEMNTEIGGCEKKNAANEIKVQRELNRRENHEGKSSDEKLEELKPIKLVDVLENKKAIGTITLRVKGSLNGQQAFCIWKTRQAIEQLFKTYDDTLFFDDSLMQDDATEEGCLFLNHISSIIAMNAIDEIECLDFSREISLSDLRETLGTIQADCIDGAWMVKPIKSEVRKLASKLGLDIADLSVFDTMIKWKRNPDIERPPVIRDADENENPSGQSAGEEND